GKGSKKSAVKKDEDDSSSDFEVVAFDASKAPEAGKSPGDLGSGEIPLLQGDEEVELGADVAPSGRNSGINLDDPADSGISLEDGGSSEEVEFELPLESGATPKPSALKKQQDESAPAADDEDSSSEFELSVEDSSSDFELSGEDASAEDSSS